ncbi:dienelactone hydrolase family protein [Micromonospora sp. NBC_01796]|uniref:dienelactone hydrolase family protein n=1 Tax=Micromonospora sp. NBC_01796 TaxID=2975987 RepID=UPI002DDB61DC|nr:alpha/beta fold hydrolase [Micromonospora sp. NBC_01796]WSA84163.1 alpha/beta fold hydrolase [Micromonospora sp. NBC_01796]
MSIEPALAGRVRTRSVLWRSGLLLGVLLLAAGVLGIGYAGRGLHSVSVRVDGVPVEIVRPVGGGAGRPAVVVAHGYAGSGRLMRPFADTLVRRGYVVALPDLAGHAANPRPLAGEDELDRELAGVVRYVRDLSGVDPARVALLGHSMGAAAVVRVGSADPSIAATVAISLGDGAAAALQPGPRRLLLIVGALEPAGIRSVAQAALDGDAGRRMVRVGFAEHVGVLYADRTHAEAARWLDDALRNRPEQPVIAAKGRVTAGGLCLVGMLLLVIAGLVRPSVRRAPPIRDSLAPPARARLAWLAGAVAVAPVPGLVGGWLAARTLPAPVCGYLVGYFAFAGATLAAVAVVARRIHARAAEGDAHGVTGTRQRPDAPWRAAAATIGLAVAGIAAVVVPVHLGLTSAVPYGSRWWLTVLLVLATAALLGGAHAVARPPWSIGVLAAVCLPVPVAAIVGLAPGFLTLVTPLIAGLLALYLLLAGVASLTGTPWFRTIPAGALLVAWPVATSLPIT